MADISVWTLFFVLTSLLALAGWFVMFRRLQQHEERYQALIKVLGGEIHAMTNSSIGMGRRIIEIEKKLNITAEKQLELENRDPGSVAFKQAARLMEMGADVNDLVDSCGIGRPEAELMALLHKELKASEGLGHEH
ncbi:MAG: DUF2802 domain-containing protein [Pontibacterium sp.]